MGPIISPDHEHLEIFKTKTSRRISDGFTRQSIGSLSRVHWINSPATWRLFSFASSASADCKFRAWKRGSVRSNERIKQLTYLFPFVIHASIMVRRIHVSIVEVVIVTFLHTERKKERCVREIDWTSRRSDTFVSRAFFALLLSSSSLLSVHSAWEFALRNRNQSVDQEYPLYLVCKSSQVKLDALHQLHSNWPTSLSIVSKSKSFFVSNVDRIEGYGLRIL